MALSQNRNFGGDFLIPSFHGNPHLSANNYSRFLDCQYKNPSGILVPGNHDHNIANCEGDNAISHDCDSTFVLNQRCKLNKSMRNALKDKNIGDNVSVKTMKGDMNSELEELSSMSSCTASQFDDDAESKASRNEMYANNCIIDRLKEKYVCLNFEFNQMQEHHGDYVENIKSQSNKDEEEAEYSDSSENALERKYTQVFHRHEAPEEDTLRVKKQPKAPKTQQKDEKKKENKENIQSSNNKELKLILKTLKKIFRSPPVPSRDTGELKRVYEIVKTLQEEQEKFRTVIKEQQEQINNFHSKYLQAQNIIQSQRFEIKQLYSANTQLENELNRNMKELKEKFQDKINEVAHLPRAVKSEKAKADKLSRENCALVAKLQQIKQELSLARAKFEDAGQKRIKTLNKLKAAERDIKIFRSHNSILKTEKRTLFEELRKLKELNDDLKTTSSKSITRQKERGETQQRLLRKKIIDLEMELNRSRNSTNVLVEERDKLIAELHMQLNTLVHNFEVSQKHIRILRRHIYSLSGRQLHPEKVA